MFENKIYKRFKKIHDYITDSNCSYTKYFDGKCFKYKIFPTKMGDRAVISSVINKYTFTLGYHDADNSLLFAVAVDRKGNINIIQSKIDELAIFSAIYELECLIYEYKEEKRGKMLEKLLKYYVPHNGLGLFIGRK